MTKTRKTGESGRKGRKRRPRDAPPPLHGWISTDEDEIKRRQWRGRTEIDEVQALDARRPSGDYRVTSSGGRSYVVEIRSLSERINSCECHDYRANRCKYSVYRCGSSGHIRNGVLRNEVWEDSGEVRMAARRHAGAR